MKIRRTRWLDISAGLFIALGIASQAHADSISFNFNSLSDGASSSSIQTYLQNILTANNLGSVSVSGAVAEQNYNGDSHVVGGTFSGTRWSNTLGTSDGATGPLNGQRDPSQSGYYDTFLVNNNFGSNNSDRITVTFTLPSLFRIDSISFDYEIFPNADCPGNSGTGNCSSVPDFTLKADGTTLLTKLATKPTGGSPDGNNSPLSTSETAWQFIGASGVININDSNNVTQLEFIDWPAIIGIDNLTINYSDPPPRQTESVPEPASIFLLGLGLAGLCKRFCGAQKHN